MYSRTLPCGHPGYEVYHLIKNLPDGFKASMNAGVSAKLLAATLEELNVRLRAERGPYTKEKVMKITPQDLSRGFEVAFKTQ